MLFRSEKLRALNTRLTYLRNLIQRKEEVLRHIEETGNLTDEIKKSVENAKILTEVEDIYRPFKPKKRTRATIAKEAGLEGLAKRIAVQNIKEGTKEEILKNYINEEKNILNTEDALAGALDIIAEDISDNAEYRKKIRQISYRTGKIISNAVNKEEKSVYEMYYDFSEDINKIVPHRILEIGRAHV